MVFNSLLIFLGLALNCKETVVENNAIEEWNEIDENNLTKAKDRCKVHYPNSPCLVKFTKTNHQSYWAICGQETK